MRTYYVRVAGRSSELLHEQSAGVIIRASRRKKKNGHQSMGRERDEPVPEAAMVNVTTCVEFKVGRTYVVLPAYTGARARRDSSAAR